MSISEIEITSNSTSISIKNDFQSHQPFQKLQISLEISVDQEEIILRSVVEQLQSLIHLEELSIIVSTQCILEQFHILTEGFSQLINLKVFAITFSERCFAGEIHFQHLSIAFQRMTQLIDLGIYVESDNTLNTRVFVLLNESFSHLRGLLRLQIQISERNQFDDQMAQELAKGLNLTTQLQELELSLDFTYITETGMIAMGNSLQRLNNTLYKLKIVLEGYCKYQGLSRIFQSLPNLSQLKILEIHSYREINMDKQEAISIVESLSKLISLEQLSLEQIFVSCHYYEYIQLIIQLSHFKMLKQLDLEMIIYYIISLETAKDLQLAFSNLSTLEKLKLSISDYTEKDKFCISSLANSFEKLNQLTTLQLELDCKVSKIDSHYFVQSFNHIKNIEKLQLNLGYDFYIDQETLDHLEESLSNSKHLRQLHLGFEPKRLTSNRNQDKFNLKLNLMNLMNIEVLILENKRFLTNEIDNIKIEGQDILPQLTNLKKLRILRLDFLNIDKDAANTFSTTFANLKQLTNLSLKIRVTQNLFEEEIYLQFDSFSSLSSLNNLHLQFTHILSSQESESLGQSLLSLKTPTSFSLYSKFSSFNCLKSILDGFSNCKLKNLKLKFESMKDISQTLEDLRLFSSVQFLESIIMEDLDFWSENKNNEVLIDSLKQLIYLKKIVLIEEYGLDTRQRSDIIKQKTLSKTYQSLIQLMQFFPNLLEFEMRDRFKKTQIPTYGFDLHQQKEKILKIKEIGFNIYFDQQQNRPHYNLMKQLKNLRSLRLRNEFYEISRFNDQQNKYPFQDIPRFLTQLEYIKSARLKHLLTSDNLGEELRMVKHLKYLTDLSFSIDLQNVNMSDLIHFGQSLQQIDQIRKLSLKFILQEKCPPEALQELSKGISQQKLLQKLSIQFGDYQDSSSSQNIISMIEPIQQLSYLTELKLVLMNLKSQQNEEECQCNEILLRLGKNLSFISNLRMLEIHLESDTLQNIDEGISSFANGLQSNFSLKKLEITIFGVTICENAVKALGNGLMYLKQLQRCYFDFYKSEIDDCSGIFSGIKNIESLASITLIRCNVKRLSFTPLNQILLQKEGKFFCNFSDKNRMKEFVIEFDQSSEMSIDIKQSSRNPFPSSEYLKLTKQLTSLSPSIDIDLKMHNSNIFNDSNDQKIFLQYLQPLSISKLSIIINADNINLYTEGIIKIQQINELSIVFRKKNLNNNQVVSALKNLSNSIGKIFKLKLLIKGKIMKDQAEMNNFISAIKQYQSVKDLQLCTSYINKQQEAFLKKSIQRKLNYLINLEIHIGDDLDEEEDNDFYNTSDLEESDDQEEEFFN